jgi:hypothetical protein
MGIKRKGSDLTAVMERWINKGIIHGGASGSDLYYYFDERFIVMNAVQFMDYLRKRGYYE